MQRTGVSHAFAQEQVVDIVQDAYATGGFDSAKDELEAENEQGCPPN
jgi:hypothetical protein